MKIGISIYLYHTDLWEEFKTLLIPFSDSIKLYLGLCHDNKTINSKIINESKNLFDSKITLHYNYGADVAPFLCHLSLIQEPYFIKIHSKKSLYGIYNQINWRTILLHDLLGSKTLFYNNLNTILHNNTIGMIGNKNLFLTNNENNHSFKIQTLCNIMDLDYKNIKQKSFFGGNMFLSRTNLFQKYFLPYKNDLINLLKQETGKIDEMEEGTYSHSLERLFGYIVSLNNLKFAYSQLPTIKILNSKAPKKKFHMVKLHNNDCYLQEDINVYGNIINNSIENFTIQWKHILPNPIQRYRFLDSHTITKNI